VDHKKGEVNELMNLLKNPNIDKDINKKKDIIKRVIAYMTLGVDVSKQFPEMVKVKIIYFYYKNLGFIY
jgi:AP-4 complex subunit beta-1